jgi:hypothetical protein
MKLIDDQPARKDKLHFDRYLNVIDRRVLNREETTPFVVGIYGKWGIGKSTLMEMLEDKLKKESGKWEVVKFSPWEYRNEKSLLLPLLATLAKNRPDFAKLTKWIIDSGPGLIKTLVSMGIETASTGLPLLTFLKSIRDKKENVKSLSDKIEEAVKGVVGQNKRMVFLIDDLDRCHDPIQIIGLLEQIKLFLHLDRCLFFICADKDQIVKAIEEKFPNEGKNYLDKFVQLPFELPPNQSHHLIQMLGFKNDEEYSNDELLSYLMRISEVLDNNPRKLKKILNQTIISLDVVSEEMRQVKGFIHKPSIELMLKWLLLMECEPIKANPYLYMKLESDKLTGLSETTESNYESGSFREEFLEKLGLNNNTEKNDSRFFERLAVFLWHDIEKHPFKDRKTLNLYANVSSEDISRSRIFIEEKCFKGEENILLEDFSDALLAYGQFTDIKFEMCDFSRADLKGANLSNTTFNKCNLSNVRFDEAIIENTNWILCDNIDQLDTEPILYEMIADRIVEKRRLVKYSERHLEQLYKMYKMIIDLHKQKGSLTEEIEERLKEKGTKIRGEVEKEKESTENKKP